MKQKIDIFVLLFGVALFLSGCSKSDIPTPTVSTVDVTSITEMTAIAGGIISTDNGSKISARGVCWNELPNPTTSDNKTLDGVGKGSFTSTMTELKPLTTYYVRAYISNSEGTIYGNEISFITLAEVPKACFEIASIVGLKATFTNCSDYPTTCLWDFGDGNTSTENAPTHDYITPGTYNVKLVVSNEGMTDFVTKAVVISDTVNIENLPLEYYNSLIGRYIDVDCDGNKDFFIYGFSHTGPSQSTFETSIMPLGKYGIVCDSMNVDAWNSNNNPANYSTKVYVPKRYLLGNTIFNSENTTRSNIRFSYSYNSYYSSISYNSWDKDEVSYVGFINKIGNISKLGWIKLKMFGSISLYSLKMPIEGTSLLIDK